MTSPTVTLPLKKDIEKQLVAGLKDSCNKKINLSHSFSVSISQYVYNYTYSLFTPCKGIIQHSLGFWIPRCGFRIPGTGFQYFSVKL